MKKSLHEQAQRELRYEYWDSKKKRNQWLGYFYHWKLCQKSSPGAKRCNGKSTTDLKTKIIFAVDENISKGLVVIQWMITRGFVDHWKKWKSAHLISKYCTPLASSIVTACQNILSLDPCLECATCIVVSTLLRSHLVPVVHWPKVEVVKGIFTFGGSHFKLLAQTTSTDQEKAYIRKK